jgi:hypothetical protein
MGAAAGVPKRDIYAPEPTTPADFVRAMRPGTLVFFRGAGLRATLYRLVHWCDYTHVGIVDMRTLPGDFAPTVCLWELASTLDSLPCLLHRHCKTGPRLVRLEDRLREQGATAAWGDVRVCVVELFPKDGAGPAVVRALSDHISRVCGGGAPAAESLLVGALRTTYATMGVDTAPVASNAASFVADALVQSGAYRRELEPGTVTLRDLLHGGLAPHLEAGARLAQENYHFIVREP